MFIVSIHSGVSRISFRGGGVVQNIFGKMGIFAAARGEARGLLGGFGGMFPREIFLKWCNLVRFGEYFAKIL